MRGMYECSGPLVLATPSIVLPAAGHTGASFAFGVRAPAASPMSLWRLRAWCEYKTNAYPVRLGLYLATENGTPGTITQGLVKPCRVGVDTPPTGLATILSYQNAPTLDAPGEPFLVLPGENDPGFDEEFTLEAVREIQAGKLVLVRSLDAIDTAIQAAKWFFSMRVEA